MIKLFITSFLILFSCNESDVVVFTLEIDNKNVEIVHTIKLQKYFQRQKMVITINELDDTFMIGIIKVPPGKIGTLYNIDFMADNIPSYTFKPYKSKTGKLIFSHYFYNY